MLLASFSEVTALGDYGARWRTARLCWDGLVIEGVTGDVVNCSGEFMPTATFTLDLDSGAHLDGPKFRDPSAYDRR